MFQTAEKKERSLGVRLFLKPHRCSSPKCVAVRRPTKPGPHTRRRGQLSEYGQQLKEKQKFQWTYGLRDSQMKRVFSEATKNPAVTGDMIVSLLERRLDNVVYRLGFAPSRSVARQSINHGHIQVNGKKVSSSSYRVRPSEVISIKPSAREFSLFKDLKASFKNQEPPSWLYRDDEKLEGKVLALPKDSEMSFDINLVVDYYSKIVK